MTLTQLNYLLAIIDHGFNISRAAAALHTSQPGISRQIRLLEQELGVNVLVRSGGRVVGITEDGSRVVASAKLIAKEAANLKLMGEEFLQQETGNLRIATQHSLALSMLPSAVLGVRTRYPDVTIEVKYASPSSCFDLLRAGDIDLGISIEQWGQSDGLLVLPLRTIPRVLLVPRGHALLEREAIDLEDIVRYPLIFHDTLASSGWSVLRAFRARNVHIEPAIRAMDASVIKAYVEQGAGIAIVSGAAFDAQRDRGLCAIDMSHLFMPSHVSAVLDPQRYMRGYAAEFIGLLAPAWTRKKIDQAIRDTQMADPARPES